MTHARLELALGPILFHWSAEAIASFYAGVAMLPAIARVYLGEVVCGKRAPLVSEALLEAGDRLAAAGKQIVWSTPALPANLREARAMRELVLSGEALEINDVAALTALRPGQSFCAGPLLNVYNELAAEQLVRRGCTRICPNVELPLDAIRSIAMACPGLEIELFGFGRLPLALSGRCYHARLHGLHKDSCQFVCRNDPDGLTIRTVDGDAFLAMNGVQTLSHAVHISDAGPRELADAGVSAIRLSPHTGNMAAVVAAFRAFLDGASSAADLRDDVTAAAPPGPLVNGYLRGRPGMTLGA